MAACDYRYLVSDQNKKNSLRTPEKIPINLHFTNLIFSQITHYFSWNFLRMFNDRNTKKWWFWFFRQNSLLIKAENILFVSKRFYFIFLQLVERRWPKFRTHIPTCMSDIACEEFFQVCIFWGEKIHFCLKILSNSWDGSC